MVRAAAAPIKTARVAIASDVDADKFALLEAALRRADFWRHLEGQGARAGARPADVRILIKPELAVFDRGSPAGTDPELVEHLIALLHRHGYEQVAVGDTLDSSDLWLENRDVLVRADLLGYRFQTRDGRPYDVVDLADDLVPVSFPPGSVLAGTGLGRAWVEAHYRISFAKNKTDEAHQYALGLEGLIQVLPLRDKDYHYRHRLRSEDVCLELLRTTPVHFAIVDAVVSNHGGAGVRACRPLDTQTIIASADLLLADVVAAEKMGLDPAVSPVTARALRDHGFPASWEVAGDRRRYPGWVNVDPLLADSVRRRDAWPDARRTLTPWLQAVNPELFPFKDVLTARLNAFVQRYLPTLHAGPLGFWALVALNHALGAAYTALEAVRVLADKDSLRWRAAALGLDPGAYAAGDYDAVAPYVEGLAVWLGNAPVDANGLRWRHLEQSVVFEFSRTVPAPFDEFVTGVDISRAIQFMNDYIGGVAVPVSRDAAGRVIRQVERNLYLPQPNYVVLWGGPVIDVTKLEVVRYRPDEHRIFWKTVRSENGSARYDDGSVAFTRSLEGETRVTVSGRQEFTLPPLLEALTLGMSPLVKDHLVTHAYTTFFTRTVANFEAVFEGREVRIGRDAATIGDERLPTEVATDAVRRLGDFVREHWSAIGAALGRARPIPSHVDEHGFAHFPGRGAGPNGHPSGDAAGRPAAGLGPVLREVFGEFFDAVRKDWGLATFGPAA